MSWAFWEWCSWIGAAGKPSATAACLCADVSQGFEGSVPPGWGAGPRPFHSESLMPWVLPASWPAAAAGQPHHKPEKSCSGQQVQRPWVQTSAEQASSRRQTHPEGSGHSVLGVALGDVVQEVWVGPDGAHS